MTSHAADDVSDIHVIPVHIDVRVFENELASARNAIAWRRGRAEYVVKTVFGLMMFGIVGSFAANAERSRSDVMLIVFTLMAVYLIPWTRARISLSGLRLAPCTIVGILPNGMRIEVGGTETEMYFDAYPMRFETKTLFVLATKDASVASVVPKRVFPTGASLGWFRDALLAPRRSVSIAAAVQTFGGDTTSPSVQFTLAPADISRASALVLGRNPRSRQVIFWGVAAVFFALGIRKFGPTFALISAILLAALILRRWVSARAQQSGDASASALTITVDDDALRMFAASGAISHPWNTARRIVEDEKVLVIVFSGTNVIIPKRSLDDELVALIRERIPAQPSPAPHVLP